MKDMLAIMQMSPVIPVLTVGSVDEGLACARSIHAGGLKAVEITCRTEAALKTAQAIHEQVPGLSLGVGTVWSEEQARKAIAAGADFIVSPGRADPVGAVCREAGVAYLPGAHTASEIACLVDRGWFQIKLFPASVIGGAPAIKAYAAVFPDVHFCPTGGITEQNASDYLALASVPCVGGSWLFQHPVGGDDEAGAMSVVREAAERAAGLQRKGNSD